MPRLIDAAALNISKFTRWFDDPNDRKAVERMIREAPTIDPVHAAGGCYCWECKYRTKDTQWTRAGFCGRRDAGPMMIACPDDYCSRGERRKETEGE